MANKIDNDDDVKIKQINPPKGLTVLEKTAILQFEKEKDAKLSKTQEFRLINRNKKINSKINIQRKTSDGLDLPVLKNTNTKFEDEFVLPKKKSPSLYETIVIKVDGISREAVKKKKTDLYHTAIIKLDSIIKNRDALKRKKNEKVDSVEELKRFTKRFHLFKPRDITRLKNIKINVDSEEFGRQLYNLNKLALNNLSLLKPKKLKTRKYSTINKLKKIDNVKIKKSDYLKYQDKLNKFAINKLYYKFAPKESKQYKIYKAGVILSSLAFIISLGFVINWGVQGIITNKISKDLNEKVDIVEVIDEGEIVTVEDPVEADPAQAEMKEDLYWKYLNTPLSSVDLSQLIKENNDTVGWIIVKNTNVNYPVVQTSNNDYYLSHSFTKQYNSAGWVYADFRDNFDTFNRNMVIYGHGRYDKVMFGSLTNTLKKDWYTNPDNQIIQLSTVNYNTMWQIFSVYKIQSESYYITTDFGSDESYSIFLNEMKNRSIYDFGVNLTTKDKILTLSTCYNDNGIRLVVQAKLVKIQQR